MVGHRALGRRKGFAKLLQRSPHPGGTDWGRTDNCRERGLSPPNRLVLD